MRLDRLINTLTLLAISLILMTAFYFQLAKDELPCALCNLQRVSFMMFGSGLLLNTWHNKPLNANYILSAIGALIGSLVGLMQMFVHVLPGTPPVGDTVFGMHMYTATYITLTAAHVYCVIMLANQDRFQLIFVGKTSRNPAKRPFLVCVSAALFALMVVANLFSVVLQCGFHPLSPAFQKHYRLLYEGNVMQL